MPQERIRIELQKGFEIRGRFRIVLELELERAKIEQRLLVLRIDLEDFVVFPETSLILSE